LHHHCTNHCRLHLPRGCVDAIRPDRHLLALLGNLLLPIGYLNRRHGIRAPRLGMGHGPGPKRRPPGMLEHPGPTNLAHNSRTTLVLPDRIPALGLLSCHPENHHWRSHRQQTLHLRYHPIRRWHPSRPIDPHLVVLPRLQRNLRR
jgi:hypothetical protein